MLRLRTLKSPYVLAGLFALLVGALPFPALADQLTLQTAQSTELKAAAQEVTESVTQLEQTQDVSSSRDALLKIFDLTLAEINDLLTKDRLMQATIDKDADVADLAQFHAATLKSDAKYIVLLKEQASTKLITLDELRTMASEFKLWRVGYDAETKEIFDLLLFLQARAVLGTANSRLALIASDVKKLNTVASKADVKSLAQLLSGAQKNLAGARINQQNAKTGLLILQAKHLAPPSEEEQIEGTDEMFIKNIKEVFLKVSATYKDNFFVMSSIAQKY